MAELPPPIQFTGSGFNHLGPEPLSYLNNVYPRVHNLDTHFLPQPHHAPEWQPATWDASSQRRFPPTPVDLGCSPDHGPPPHAQPRPHIHTANDTNVRKRKRTTPSSVEASSIGRYSPLSPRETVMGTDSRGPSPPPCDGPRNATCNVWAFAQPLESGDEPPTDRWPTSMEPHLMRKPKAPWVGCKLCSQFGYVIHLSIFRWLILIPVQFSDKSGTKRWKVFKNNEKSSPTTPFRRHLKVHHTSIWVRECTRLNIPVPLEQDIPEQTPYVSETELFTREGLLRRLIKFVSGDDQVYLLQSAFELLR